MASIFKRRRKRTLPDGRVVYETASTWTIQYRDSAGRWKRQACSRDKQVAFQTAAELEKRVSRGEVDLTDRFALHRAAELKGHLEDYIADLRAKGRDQMYVYNTDKRLRKLALACVWKNAACIEPNSFLRWRQKEKTSDRKGPGKSRCGLAAKTLNQYLDTAKAFCNWMVQQNRMAANPLISIDKADGPAMRKRRALTDDEVARILKVATPERRLLYRLALSTGLRRQELVDLLWGDLGLRAIKPYIQLRAEATKSKRADRLPLQAALAADLRQHRTEGTPDSQKVFASVPSIEVWKEDLAAARIVYKDDLDRQADFHAGTRKTLCTRMNRHGVPLAVAMRIMRHTDARLTLVDYVDDQQIGTEEALARLPEIQPAASVPAADDKSAAAQ